MSRRRQLSAISIASVFGLWVLWIYIILREARAETSLFGDDGSQLDKLGQFGDSFGVFASLMTALAAAAAIAAFISQQMDSRIGEFERHFYTLLNNLQMLISEIDVTRFSGASKLIEEMKEAGKTLEQRSLELRVERPFMTVVGSIEGRDAIRYLLNRLRMRIGDSERFSDSKQIASEYEKFFRRWNDDLGHYFRTSYHIFKIIDEDCPDDKQKYARIARSHFSNSELILLAYNCSVGVGRFKFKKFVNKYSLMHNVTSLSP